jgi:crotonobetainyl-CoA:carnitine CoA-transferase CaiB-like acyl-CoA transferase
MGATIVKVEPPSGDPLELMAPAWYASLGAGAEVIRADLKTNQGRERMAQLLATADVLITSSRPSSLERLGLAWADLHDRHPRLCAVAIVGYPAPRADVTGHDLTYQAEAGLVAPPALPRTLIADLAGAQRAAMAALELLFVRERRGGGGHAEISLAESAKLFAAPLHHGLTQSDGLLGGAAAAYNLYTAREGQVAVAALEPHLRTALARELGVDVDDSQALARAFRRRSARDWARWADLTGLPVTAVKG